MNLEINYIKTGKLTNMGILNNILLNSQWVKGKIFLKYLETNKNRNITYHTLCDAAKAALRRQVIAYLRKQRSLK